jgi:single-stranded DNA-binding protein
MHTLFMIEMSVRKTMPLSGSFLALFLMQPKIFSSRKENETMFTQISLMGRVTADLEIQTSTNGTDYIQFNVAVNKGFGEQEHPNFYQCVLFGKATERISKAGVRKGSLLFITGDLDLVEFTRKADGSKGMIPKITVYDWNYVPAGKRAEGSNANADSGAPAPAGADDGFMNVEDCGENGLPFN